MNADGDLMTNRRPHQALKLRHRPMPALVATVVGLLVVEGLLRLVDTQPGVLALFLSPAGGARSYRLKPNLDLAAARSHSRARAGANFHG